MGLRQAISRQLSNPSGLGGRVIARAMNRGNADMNQAAVDRLELSPGDRVLDLGFGGGAAITALRATGAEVTGADRAPDMVAAARQAHPDATFVEADVSALPFDADAFDAVLSVNTVYFWRDLPAALTEVRRVIRPGGRLVIGIRGEEIMRRVDRSIFTVRSPDEVAEAVRAAGFADVRLDSPEERPVHFVVGTA